jgi:signal transduction histidine kinase
VIVPTLVRLDPVIVEAKVVPVNVPALTVPKFACTYSVVATFVELSFVAGVGAVGVPVNAGEASGDFKAKLVLIVAISEELAVMLVVFADTFVFNVAMLFEFAVILAVFAFKLFVNVNSAALAVVASVVMAVAFVAIEVVFVEIAVAFAVILAVFAATFVGKVAIVLELTPPTELTVVAKEPFPDPVTSPVNAVVAFAAITSVPITKPKFVLAPAAVEAPVPPFKTARLPLIFAEVILLSATPAFALC